MTSPEPSARPSTPRSNELAANLATTDDAHLFGDNEFQIRALAHKIAAKAIEQHLAQKKTDTKEPA